MRVSQNKSCTGYQSVQQPLHRNTTLEENNMKSKIRVRKNIWGNYVCYIGNERHIDFGREWDATAWLWGRLETGEFELSGKSDITSSDVVLWSLRAQ